jgi:membrane associated rhomboid family serine protease
MWVFAFMCFWEVVGLRQRIKKVDHVAHLGGIATGVVASELIKYRARVKRAQLEGQAKIGKLFGNAK